MIRKIAAEADKAKISSEIMIVAFGFAKKLKLAKRITSQKTNTTRNCMGIGLPGCSKRRSRVPAISMANSKVRDRNARCASFFGESI